MINSRNIIDLHPVVAEKCKQFIESCKKEGVDVIVTSTYRDSESQNELYAQGRTKPGNKVTNSPGGESIHNYKCAFDIAVKKNGKVTWDLKDYRILGEVNKKYKLGLEWGGDWVSFKDMPHFQFLNGLTSKQFKDKLKQAGKNWEIELNKIMGVK